MKKFYLILLLCLAAAAGICGESPKYIFLFIGDGMAAPQRMIAEKFSKINGGGDLIMNHLPHQTTTRTGSANSIVTDSAAAATAIACGTKTDNTVIGLAPNGEKLVSIAEDARDSGRKIGIISTVFMNHATPAGFYGHRSSRSLYYELGLDMVSSGFDFFGGGGIAARNNADSPNYRGNIVDLAEEAGYRVVFGKDGLLALTAGQKAIALANRQFNTMPYMIDANENDMTLADITAKAIEMLDNPDGFFIMVEGGSIDLAGHANEAAANIYEVIALNDAVIKAMDFYEKHPDETLIVVTGDHETGGMTAGFAGSGVMDLELLALQKCSIAAFNAKLKEAADDDPDFSFEKAREMLSEYFGFRFSGEGRMLITAQELGSLQKAFTEGKLPDAARIIINSRSGISWSTGGHTALPTITTAIGVGAESFEDAAENTDIASKIRELL